MRPVRETSSSRPVRPVGAGRRQQTRHPFQMIRQPQVVVTQVRDEHPACLPQRSVAVGVTERRRLGPVVPDDAPIAIALDEIGGAVGAAVARDQEFEIRQRLRERRLDGEGEHFPPVVRGQEDADDGGLHGGDAASSEATGVQEPVRNAIGVQGEPVPVGIPVIVRHGRKVDHAHVG